jgi:DNA-binding transcriptional LysR family regulator
MDDMLARKGVSVERLRTLREVVRAGSIMAAADRDPNRQSLISRQISELEQALGVELLDRASKPHRPTAVAERLAQAHERFVRELEAAAGTEDGRPPLVIGAGQLVIRGLLIPWLGKKRGWRSVVRKCGVWWRRWAGNGEAAPGGAAVLTCRFDPSR